jgi:hypothetical protein
MVLRNAEPEHSIPSWDPGFALTLSHGCLSMLRNRESAMKRCGLPLVEQNRNPNLRTMTPQITTANARQENRTR